jgi:hypothetical protein
MSKADNVVIDRDDIVESRRGFNFFSDFGVGTDRAKQLLQYKDRILVHYNNKLLFENSLKEFSEFSGDYNEVYTGHRIKGLENKGNFYFTTDEGVKKISAKNSSQFTTSSGYITNSGAARALDLSLKCNYKTTGFFDKNSVVAYRVVWGYKDTNNNLLLGYPSEIAIIRNVDQNESCTVDLTITIPTEVISSPNTYFYQVYRSNIKEPYDTVADVEFKLVIEDFPTTAELSSGVVTTNDLTPVDFRNSGADLYTNEISGEGEQQANKRPPLCTDIAFFNGSVFYSNTKTRHNKSLSLITADYMTTGVSKFYIASEDGVQTYTFVGTSSTGNVTFTDDVIANYLGTYFLISSANNNREYFLWFDTTGTDTAPSGTDTLGKIPLMVDISTATNKEDVALFTQLVLDALIDFDVTVNGVTTNQIDILWVNNGESNGIVQGITAAPITKNYTDGSGENTSNQEVFLSNDPSAGIKLEETAKSMVKVINSNSSEIVNAFYISSVNDLPGQILIEAKTAEDKNFYLATKEDIKTDFNPTLPAINEALVASLTGNTVIITWTDHGLSTGNTVVLFNNTGITGVINGIYEITVIDTDNFSVNISGLSGTLGTVDGFKTTEVSDNEEKPNRVYFSKEGIPEAVPSFNYFDVGSQDSEIKRIISLRDSLFILKDEGVYRLSGINSTNFNVVLFDESAPLIAEDSPAVLNNQIFMLSTQGVVSVSDTGVNIISRNIESDILYPTSNNFPNFSTQCFGFASESDRAYFLFLPEETDDTYATQCFRYNVFTRAWVRWPISKTCGLVKKANDKIYFGASDTNFIEQERKDFLRSDYADREYSNTILGVQNGNILELSSIQKVEEFDSIYQEQYITISRFNRLLASLDNDPFLDDNDYESTLSITTGADLSAAISLLITKVDADDTTRIYTPYSGDNTNTSLRDGFNAFVNELNLSSGTFYANYKTYTDIVRYEVILSDVDEFQVQATGLIQVPFIVGDVTLYKAIDCFVEYGPENLGNPSVGKQFREAKLFFDQYNFTFASMGFRSDVYASRQETLFQGEGNGDYGTQIYGEKIYGGLSNEKPFRTYIPRNYQRCIHLILSLRHKAARESFKLNGYAVTYKEETSERYYKR